MPAPTPIDPVQLLVMANRIDGICREMTNTLVRTARSTTLVARDFSCSISTAQHELFAAPEGAPVHVYGSGLLCEAMADLHPDFQEGDAFLHNDPYLGNTHPADWTILVPVFYEGAHVFTTCVKAHQADTGNALPTTYMPNAIDVYAEGALIFPCVRIQEHYQDVGDIIRICRTRIRAPDIWYGDYLSMLAGARVGEQRLKELCAKYGVDTVTTFVRDWMDYAERMAISEIGKLPPGHIHAETTMDGFPRLPQGLHLQATIDVDPAAGRVTVDLRDNDDCTPTGLNLSEATAMNCGVLTVLTVLNSKRSAKSPIVPQCAGSFRPIQVLLRDNCVVGIPTHPVSCSMATNTVCDRALAMVYSGFSQLADGLGLAEPCWGSPPFQGVVSGYHPKRGEPYVAQLFSGSAGGAASAESDGWLTYLLPNGGGLNYIDECEVIEQKYPFVHWDCRIRPDSEGAGRTRSAPGPISRYGPLHDPMDVHYSLEGRTNVPRGVRGGGPARGPAADIYRADGTLEPLPDMVGEQTLQPRERIVSHSSGGGGYGPPHHRDPQRVLTDVVEGYISPARAKDTYAVALTGDPARVETLRVDASATATLRA